MSAPKRFPDWLRERVRQEVREATKPRQPTKPKPVQAKPPTPPKLSPPVRPGVTIHAAPDTAGPTELANRALAQRVLPPMPDTDAHDQHGFTPCWVCGGATGVHATYRGPWRQHTECTTVAARGVSRLCAAVKALGLGEVSLTDAGLLSVAAPVFSSVHPEPTWTDGERMTTSWAHVDRRALVKALGGLPSLRVEAGLVLCECVTGPCAWCGTKVAVGWTDAGQHWANGDPAPLCGGCYRVFVRHSEPSFAEDVRLALAELVTGVPVNMGETPPAGLVPFADSDAEPGTPWAHLDPEAVRSYRFTVWSRFGLAYCPNEHRDEVKVWAAERDRVRAERAAERAAEDAVRANVHGF